MREAGEGGSAVVGTEQATGAVLSVAIGTSGGQRRSGTLARDTPIHWRVGGTTLGGESPAGILDRRD